MRLIPIFLLVLAIAIITYLVWIKVVVPIYNKIRVDNINVVDGLRNIDKKLKNKDNK